MGRWTVFVFTRDINAGVWLVNIASLLVNIASWLVDDMLNLLTTLQIRYFNTDVYMKCCISPLRRPIHKGNCILHRTVKNPRSIPKVKYNCSVLAMCPFLLLSCPLYKPHFLFSTNVVHVMKVDTTSASLMYCTLAYNMINNHVKLMY